MTEDQNQTSKNFNRKKDDDDYLFNTLPSVDLKTEQEHSQAINLKKSITKSPRLINLNANRQKTIKEEADSYRPSASVTEDSESEEDEESSQQESSEADSSGESMNSVWKQIDEMKALRAQHREAGGGEWAPKDMKDDEHAPKFIFAPMTLTPSNIVRVMHHREILQNDSDSDWSETQISYKSQDGVLYPLDWDMPPPPKIAPSPFPDLKPVPIPELWEQKTMDERIKASGSKVMQSFEAGNVEYSYNGNKGDNHAGSEQPLFTETSPVLENHTVMNDQRGSAHYDSTQVNQQSSVVMSPSIPDPRDSQLSSLYHNQQQQNFNQQYILDHLSSLQYQITFMQQQQQMMSLPQPQTQQLEPNPIIGSKSIDAGDQPLEVKEISNKQFHKGQKYIEKPPKVQNHKDKKHETKPPILQLDDLKEEKVPVKLLKAPKRAPTPQQVDRPAPVPAPTPSLKRGLIAEPPQEPEPYFQESQKERDYQAMLSGFNRKSDWGVIGRIAGMDPEMAQISHIDGKPSLVIPLPQLESDKKKEVDQLKQETKKLQEVSDKMFEGGILVLQKQVQELKEELKQEKQNKQLEKLREERQKRRELEKENQRLDQQRLDYFYELQKAKHSLEKRDSSPIRQHLQSIESEKAALAYQKPQNHIEMSSRISQPLPFPELQQRKSSVQPLMPISKSMKQSPILFQEQKRSVPEINSPTHGPNILLSVEQTVPYKMSQIKDIQLPTIKSPLSSVVRNSSFLPYDPNYRPSDYYNNKRIKSSKSVQFTKDQSAGEEQQSHKPVDKSLKDKSTYIKQQPTDTYLSKSQVAKINEPAPPLKQSTEKQSVEYQPSVSKPPRPASSKADYTEIDQLKLQCKVNEILKDCNKLIQFGQVDVNVNAMQGNAYIEQPITLGNSVDMFSQLNHN